jgi:glycosyltransferase involved in cell wall biosynthesis
VQVELVAPRVLDQRHRHQLQALARQLQVADRITWQVTPRQNLAGALAGADVVVFPSVWEEPFGLVPLEAMACGVPVAATAVGGAAEFLADGRNCLTFPPGDPDGLTRVLHRLAGDGALRRRLVDGGRCTAAALDVDQLAETLAAWHLAAAGGPGAPRPAHRPRPGVAPTPVEPAG